MKYNITFLCIAISFQLMGQHIQEKNIQSKVNAVTVFLESAQITRHKAVTVAKGETILKFIKLSPYIDAKSIQVKTKDVEIQAVNFQKNFLDQNKRDTTLIALGKQLEKVQEEIEVVEAKRSVLKEELQFLKSNRSIGGEQRALSITVLKQASGFYSERLTSIKMKQVKMNRTLKKLQSKVLKLRSQIENFEPSEETASGEILVKVKTNKAQKSKLTLVYKVANAGWYPSYDIRAKNINSPLQLVYKANVKQNTKVDWNNVKIRFSSATPSESGSAPELKTYYLDYGAVPPSYVKAVKKVSGQVRDRDGVLPGVSVFVKGTTIGTETDFNGNYSLSIPKNGGVLVYSFLGMKTTERHINNSVINVEMKEEINALDEVVVSGFANGSGSYSISKVTARKEKRKPKYSIPTVEVVNQTTVDFAIVTPYTVKSDNKNYTVGMKTYEVNAAYQYLSIPKIDQSVYLIVTIKDWEKYHLLEGEANIYFENTYVGKSLIDTRYTKNKLKISLGKDKNVIVQREKVKDFTEKQFIGSKKIETKQWKITVKNNKNQTFIIKVYDQIPVSTREEIKVTLDKITTGFFDKKTGKILWNFRLQPKETKELNLKYAVKHPKNGNLVLD